jgi:putative oxidoreductase
VLGNLLKTSSVWHTIPLRLVLGLVFLGHGGQKVFGWFGGPGLQKVTEMFASMGFSPVMAALAAYGEFFGGLLILLGLLTRFGALTLAIIMLVAIFKVHWGKFFLPEGFEYAFTLLGISLSLLISGGGALSMDLCLEKKLPCCKKEDATS